MLSVSISFCCRVTIDFNSLAANFNGTGKTFSQGNFNYDANGAVDTTDFNLLAGNFGKVQAGDAAHSATASSTPAAALPDPVSASPSASDSHLKDVLDALGTDLI